jgi:hypothetical protein
MEAERQLRRRDLGWGRVVSARIAVVVLTLASTTWLGAQRSSAGVAGDHQGTCTTVSGGQQIEVQCSSGSTTPIARPRGIIAGPSCRWTAVTPLGFFGPDVDLEQATTGNPFTYITHGDGSIGREWPGGRTQKGWFVYCDNGSGGFRWISTGVSTDEVINAAYDEARRRIPSPILDVNPPAEAGSVVNLGLWLAIEPAGEIVVPARAGDVWATVTARLAETEWTFGNGDRTRCLGTGTPISDLDVVDEGPCGYTYRRSSPEDAPYQLSVAASWTITYQSSAGSGSLGPIGATRTVDYDVDEVQTIGVNG